MAQDTIRTMPNATAALLRAILQATAYALDAGEPKEIAARHRAANYLNQPLTVVREVLTGTYADGLGGVKKDPSASPSIPSPMRASRSGR